MDSLINIAVEDVSVETLLETLQEISEEKAALQRELDSFKKRITQTGKTEDTVSLRKIAENIQDLKDNTKPVDMIRLENDGEEQNYILNMQNISSIEQQRSDLIFTTTDNRPPIRVGFKDVKAAKKGLERIQSYVYRHVFVVNPKDINAEPL